MPSAARTPAPLIVRAKFYLPPPQYERAHRYNVFLDLPFKARVAKVPLLFILIQNIHLVRFIIVKQFHHGLS